MEFLNKLKFLNNKICIGVYLNRLVENEFDMDIVELIKTKSSVEIEKKESYSGNLNDLIEKISSNVPVILSFDGKSIIHKKIDTKGKKEKEYINLAFPNINLQDFYVQTESIDERNVYISLIRKDVIDDLIDKLIEKDISIHQVYLGPFAINVALPIIDEKQEIKAANYSLAIENSVIKDINKVKIEPESHEVYNVDSEQITTKFIIPFASALDYFIDLKQTFSSDIKQVIRSKEEFLFYRLFKLYGIAFLGTILLALLINFIVFSHYNDKYNLLSGEYNQQKDVIAKYNALTLSLDSKEKLISNKELYKRTKFSFYSDRIAILLPQSIQLTKMVFQPLEDELNKEEQAVFKENKLFINGISQSSSILEEWMGKLKAEPWVNKLIMLNYIYKKKLKQAEFYLEIEISATNETIK